MRGVTGPITLSPVVVKFLLTRLMRGVTPLLSGVTSALSFLLTRLMRGVTALAQSIPQQMGISTHTPHARRDAEWRAAVVAEFHFYSHASCEA